MAEHRTVTGEMLAAEAIAGLQADPAKWGKRRSCAAATDDLTALELRYIRVLSGIGWHRPMTLTHEPGRACSTCATSCTRSCSVWSRDPDVAGRRLYADDARTAPRT